MRNAPPVLFVLVCAATAYACSGGSTSPSSSPTASDAGTLTTSGDAGEAVAPDGGRSGVHSDAGAVGSTAHKLALSGSQLVDSATASVVRLRGANLQGIDDAGAVDMADHLHMNFARLRLSWQDANRDDNDPTGFSAAYRAQVDTWVKALTAHGIWTLLEMRTDDATANDAQLYTTTTAVFASYRKAWTYLARTYRDTDYVAGYGLLAEPSPDKAKLADFRSALITFQRALMDAVVTDAVDTKTPFFIGAAYNYDALEMWNDAYHDSFPAYGGRLVYEVNFLAPKPWINDGTSVDGSSVSYPGAAVTDFSALLTVAPGESYTLPTDGSRVFNARSATPASWAMQLAPGFPAWYFGEALAFRNRHGVPIVADQFGASTTAGGQLAFEKNLIDFYEANDIHWSRWGYNAGSTDRQITGNASVEAFYASEGLAFPHP